MKCPYPDCPGEVQPGEQFCGECGRSLAPAAVQAALAGMQARSGGAPVTTPINAPQTEQPINTYRPPITAPIPTTPPQQRAAGPPVGLIVGAGVGLLIVLVLCTAGAVALSSLTNGTPTPSVAQNAVQQSLQFQLADLSAENDWQVVHPLETAGGDLAGMLTISRGGTYDQQGAGEKIVSIILDESGEAFAELAASVDSAYEGSGPGWTVVTEGELINLELPSGLQMTINPRVSQIEVAPLLPNGVAGNQPIFTSLALDITVSGTVNQ